MRTPDPARMRSGHRTIDPLFLDTPLIRKVIPQVPGTEILFKDERASPIRSFKGRGAELVAQALPQGTCFVCASAGNFGQGLAWAVRRRRGRLVVFAAATAARCKVEAMRALGAHVVLGGADFDEAKDRARAFSARDRMTFVEDGAHAEIAEGAGTIGLELTDACSAIEAVFVPLGNGSLAAGLGGWFKQHAPGAEVVAVAASGAPAMGRAVLGQRFETSGCDTIADGIAVRVPVIAAVDVVRRVVDRVVFVSDDQIRVAMHAIEDVTGDIVEPAGAAGLAGLLATPAQRRGGRVAIPICGGNRDPGAYPPASSALPPRERRPS